MTTQEYLNITSAGGTPEMGDILSYGLQNALTVMLVVFAVLGILFLILSVSGAIFANIGKSKKAEKKLKKVEKPIKVTKTKTEAKPASDDLAVVLSAAVMAAQNDGELIAVITAAIEAARAETGETTAFRVVSFRRR